MAAVADMTQHLLPVDTQTEEMDTCTDRVVAYIPVVTVSLLAAVAAVADIIMPDMLAALAAYISASIFKGV